MRLSEYVREIIEEDMRRSSHHDFQMCAKGALDNNFSYCLLLSELYSMGIGIGRDNVMANLLDTYLILNRSALAIRQVETRLSRTRVKSANKR